MLKMRSRGQTMVHGKKKFVSIENNPLHCENLIELLKIEF